MTKHTKRIQRMAENRGENQLFVKLEMQQMAAGASPPRWGMVCRVGLKSLCRGYRQGVVTDCVCVYVILWRTRCNQRLHAVAVMAEQIGLDLITGHRRAVAAVVIHV